MSQYVHGEYTLNDGSGWKLKVAKDEEDDTWKIYTKFDTSDYESVANPAPVFVYDKNHTDRYSSSGEFGNEGKYLSTVTIPITGWYLDENCTIDAIATLTWKGAVKNPMDDHQFTVTGAAIYRKNADGETECKYLAGTFYSDADRAKGENFLKNYAGTYRFTAAEDKCYIEIDEEGKVTVYASDSQKKEHVYTNVAMDLTMEKNTTKLNFGEITNLVDIKAVVPEWRSTKTNNTLENIIKCQETTFTFKADAHSSYFTPAANAFIYDDAKENGSPWEVVTKSSAADYNKPFTKLYTNDRAYSDENKQMAKDYFSSHAGTYYINDPTVDYKITITEDGEIYWGDLASGEKDDITVGFEAKLPDGVGKITIDGQKHKILRDTFANPNTIIMDPEISLMALEKEGEEIPEEHYAGAILQVGAGDEVTLKNVTIDGEGKWEIDRKKLDYDKQLNMDYDINVLDDPNGGHPITELEGNLVSTDSLIKVAGGTLILDGVTLENFFAGDGYDDDRHFIDFMSTEKGKLEVKSNTVFRHNASRSGVCIGNTDQDEIDLSDCTTMQNNYCYGSNGGLVVAMEGSQVHMDNGTLIKDNIAADTNGVFVQLHKKTDGVKDGDNKGEIFSKLYMDGGEITGNIGLRGGSYGWGQTIYLYNGGAFEMNDGLIHDNIGAGISSIYQQPSADAVKLNGGHIYDNSCSLKDGDLQLDIALMNEGNVGEKMTVEENFVVGAAAILGGYASGDERLVNDGIINGSISVYSYFNNEGRTTTVINNNLITGNVIAENGSTVINEPTGLIEGYVKVRGSLTESAGESVFHNAGTIRGDAELAENAHLFNCGEIYGNVSVRS